MADDPRNKALRSSVKVVKVICTRIGTHTTTAVYMATSPEKVSGSATPQDELNTLQQLLISLKEELIKVASLINTNPSEYEDDD